VNSGDHADDWDADEDGADASFLDALYGEEPADLDNEGSQTGAMESESDDADEVESLIFTVTNPPGTVSVTALPNGAPYRVDLATRAARMTENELAEEISIIARLAKQNALAGQHLLMSAMLANVGVDRAYATSYLHRELGLPTVEAALADKTEVFATRYPHEQD
jgi:hypothetical protein